jgi:hypothetical protein
MRLAGASILLSASVLAWVGSACGGSDDDVPPPECNGTSCVCPAGEACDLGGSECESDSCSLGCTDGNECTGECGASCSVDCSGGSTCEVTVGESGSVSCGGGSTCTVTCTGSCSLSCSPDSTCELRCSGEDPKPIEEGGSCE